MIQDNSRVHNSHVSKAAIATNGVNLIRLPPYSPDLNIIELVWHDLKHYVRLKPCFTYYEAKHRVKKFFRYKLTPNKLFNYVNHFVNALAEVIRLKGEMYESFQYNLFNLISARLNAYIEYTVLA